MTNDEMLRNIEYLREKADVSYEEAEALLDRNDGNVMRVLVELERQGRVYQTHAEDKQAEEWAHCKREAKREAHAAKEKAEAFVKKAFSNRIIVEKKRPDGGKDTLVNLSVPVAAGVALVAPYLALASTAVTFVAGYQVKVGKDEDDKA